MPVLCLKFENQVDVNRVAEVFYRYSPRIAVRENEALFVDLSKTKKNFVFESWPERIRFILSKFNAKASWSIAPDAATAFSMAKVGIYDKQKLPLETLSYFSNPFSSQVDDSQRVDDVIDGLKSRGFSSLRDFLTMPLQLLMQQFGTKTLRLKSNVEDGSFVQWPRYQPESFSPEILDVEDQQIQSVENCFFYLKTGVERAMIRLNARSKNVRRMAVLLKMKNAEGFLNVTHAESIHFNGKVSSRKAYRQICESLSQKFSDQELGGTLKQIEIYITQSSSQVDQLQTMNRSKPAPLFEVATKISSRKQKVTVAN